MQRKKPGAAAGTPGAGAGAEDQTADPPANQGFAEKYSGVKLKVSFGQAGGVIQNKHSTNVESPPPSLHTFIRIHAEIRSCSDLGRVFTVNDPPTLLP